MKDIKSKLKNIFVKALRSNLTPDEIPDQDLIHYLGIDSITSLEVLIWVENEFNIIIEDDDLSPALVDSLDTLEAYVSKKMLKINDEILTKEGPPID